MSCQCNFTLHSRLKAYGEFLIHHSVEEYKLPCDRAIEFLQSLDKPFRGAYEVPLHEVKSYEIKEGNNSYTYTESEMPSKTAAKVKLFMQNPSYLPKNR